ncbi:MAG: hypothetical protein VX252_15935, partial [Myxococcota bacterium]|nr:hypothetical protein [Myxococcota bacterium]
LLLREVHPVNQVSSPTKFGEYLASGVPVIATNGISDFSAWILEHEVGFTLDHGDLADGTAPGEEVSQFLDAIKQDREAWRSRCTRLCEEKLNWTSRIQEISSAYSSLGEELDLSDSA